MRAQAKTRHHDPLAAANQLAVHLLPRAEHMCVEPAPYHRSEANDDLGFQARHQGAAHVAVDLAQGECAQAGRRARANDRGMISIEMDKPDGAKTIAIE